MRKVRIKRSTIKSGVPMKARLTLKVPHQECKQIPSSGTSLSYQVCLCLFSVYTESNLSDDIFTFSQTISTSSATTTLPLSPNHLNPQHLSERIPQPYKVGGFL